MALVRLEIFLPINTYYWNMVQICNAFVYFFIHGDFIMTWCLQNPSYTFFPEILSSSESEEKDEWVIGNVNQVFKT